MQDPLETYKRNTREVIDQFLRHVITFPDCVTRLGTDLATAKESIDLERIPDLAEAMLVSNARVMREIERRGKKRRADAARMRFKKSQG
jgi:hypothetical protein